MSARHRMCVSFFKPVCLYVISVFALANKQKHVRTAARSTHV